MCSGHHAGSTGRAARPRAGHTRYLTFTHTDSPVSRRGPPPGWTPHGCVGAGHHAPPDTVGSTHQASPDDLPQRPRALSDHLRAPGSKRTLSLPVRSRCDEVVRRPMTKSVPLDAPLDGDRHTGALRAQSVAHRDSDFCAGCFCSISGSHAIDLEPRTEFGARRFEQALIGLVTLRATSHNLVANGQPSCCYTWTITRNRRMGGCNYM